MTPQFWWLAVGGIVFYALLFAIDRRFGRRLLNRDFNERERVLAASIMKSEQAYSRMETTIDLLSKQLKDRDSELALMRLNSTARDGKIQELTQEVHRLQLLVDHLTHELQQKNVISEPLEPELKVLGIWPTPPGQVALDQQSEADALYDAGYDYVALRGGRAIRSGVIWEVDRVHPNTILVGGHGDKDGILLTDGTAEPGWWAELVRGREIRLMIMLSCESSQQDELNLSDVLIRAGVGAVITCDGRIEDAHAVQFVQLLLAKLSQRVPLSEAVRMARMAVPRRSAEMIRLRLKEAK